MPAPAANGLDHLTDRVDHELRVLLVDLVTTVGAGDVFRVRHELGEPLLRLFLRGIDDVAEVPWNIGRQHARRNH